MNDNDPYDDEATRQFVCIVAMAVMSIIALAAVASLITMLIDAF